MKNLICLFLLIPFTISAQKNDYKWSSVENVKFYDMRKFNIRIFSINDIPKEAKYVTFKTQEWQEIFPSITKKRIDVIKEDHYIIVVKFKDGAIIPFEFLPKQKAIFDLRKNHFNVVFFGANTFEKIDTLFKKSIECLEDPKCNNVK